MKASPHLEVLVEEKHALDLSYSKECPYILVDKYSNIYQPLPAAATPICYEKRKCTNTYLLSKIVRNHFSMHCSKSILSLGLICDFNMYLATPSLLYNLFYSTYTYGNIPNV